MDNDTGRSRGTQKYPRGLRCRQKGNAREKRRIGQVQQNKAGAFLPLQNASGVKAALNCWNESVRPERASAPRVFERTSESEPSRARKMLWFVDGDE